MAGTLAEKVWENHIVRRGADGAHDAKRGLVGADQHVLAVVERDVVVGALDRFAVGQRAGRRACGFVGYAWRTMESCKIAAGQAETCNVPLK